MGKRECLLVVEDGSWDFLADTFKLPHPTSFLFSTLALSPSLPMSQRYISPPVSCQFVSDVVHIGSGFSEHLKNTTSRTKAMRRIWLPVSDWLFSLYTLRWPKSSVSNISLQFFTCLCPLSSELLVKYCQRLLNERFPQSTGWRALNWMFNVVSATYDRSLSRLTLLELLMASLKVIRRKYTDRER